MCVFMTRSSPPLCAGEGRWKISEALNTSRRFHVIDGLEPETEYTVRLIPNAGVDHSSIFEDVITTGSAGEEVNQGDSSYNKKKRKKEQIELPLKRCTRRVLQR